MEQNSLKINPHTYGQLISDKGGKTVQWRIKHSYGLFTHNQSESRSVVSDSLRPHGLYSPRNSPSQNTGAGSLSLLQGIFPTPGLNPRFLHCRQILNQLNHKGSQEYWVGIPSPVTMREGIFLNSQTFLPEVFIFYLSLKTYQVVHENSVVISYLISLLSLSF